MTSEKVWFTADTHFADRKAWDNNFNPSEKEIFESVEHRDETIVKNWNARIKSGDKVYVLGDVGFDNAVMHDILPRLNGRKRLILGNHDYFQRCDALQHFKKIFLWKDFGDFICTHLPIHESLLRYHAQCCVHGHTHARHLKDPRYINICIQNTGFAPLSLEDLRVIMSDRKNRVERPA